MILTSLNRIGNFFLKINRIDFTTSYFRNWVGFATENLFNNYIEIKNLEIRDYEFIIQILVRIFDRIFFQNLTHNNLDHFLFHH